MKHTQRKTWSQDPPFSKTNIGRACLYDDVPCVVSSVGEGPYGENVTFSKGTSTITTTPGLDHRFSWV